MAPSRSFPVEDISIYTLVKYCLSVTYNSPLVTLKFLLGGLLDTHALRLGLLSRSGALSTTRCVAVRYCASCAKRRVLMRHLRLVHFTEALSDSLALIQLGEHSTKASRRGGGRSSRLGLDIEDGWRAGRWWWGRRRATGTGSGCGSRLARRGSQALRNVLGGFTLGVPGDAAVEVVLDVIGKVTEDLVESLKPLDLFGIPMRAVLAHWLGMRNRRSRSNGGILLVLEFLEHSIAEELGRAEAFFDMLVRTVVDGDPGKHHDAIRDSAQVGVHGVRTIRLLQLCDGHESLVDGLQEVLIHCHVGSGKVRLLGLG